MKLSVLGIMLLIPLGPADEQSSADRRESQKGTKTAPPFDLSDFAAEGPVVEEEVAKATGVSREDALAMLGRSSAASGRFDAAAAAYAMFLNEFGTDHPYSERIAVRLADCLFPFKYDQVDVVHSASGPRAEPAWRMDYSPRPEHLRQAVRAFELAASLAQDQPGKGSALLKLGWVHRVLGEWDASTAAWDRCAKDAAPTKSAADALWLAAENLEWTNRPDEAANRLIQLSRDYPQDDRVSAATERVEYLQADAHRGADWYSDPVASLKSEIKARASTRSPQEVYRSVVRWRQRRGEREALIAVSRWAGTQDDRPITDRVQSQLNLVDALVNENSPTEAARVEAAQVLQDVAAIATDDDWSVPAAIRAYRLLIELNQYQEADRFLSGFGRTRIDKQPWGPMLLLAEIESLTARGEKARAKETLTRLRTLHPDYDRAGPFDGLLDAAKQEGESR